MKQIPDDNELICLAIRDGRLFLVRDSPRDKWITPHSPINLEEGITETARMILNTYFTELVITDASILHGCTSHMLIGGEYRRCIPAIYEMDGKLNGKFEDLAWFASGDALVTHIVSPDIAGIVQIPELLDRLK